MRRGIAVLVCALAVQSVPAYGQLRIVSLNASNGGSSIAGPRVGMGTILSAIGSTISDDPTLAGNTGIIKPLDVLLLQETHTPQTTGAQYAALLNSMYGTTSFSFGTLAGASTGSGSQGIIYNKSTVQLISEAVVGTASTSGQPRQTLRYQLRPVGYGADADLWVYNAHWKAGGTSTDEARRTSEANTIRLDTTTNLPAGANVIYCGDFNITSSTDDAYVAITAGGNGQAFDPINKPGSWRDSSAFKNIHTQSPWGASVNPGNGFSGSTGGMDDRYDFQLISGNLKDGRGTAYIPNSYQAFGNNGSHQMDQPINTGTGAPADALFYLSSIIDHLPIVADYQLPSRMSVGVASVPQHVIVGADVSVNVTVSNSANVLFSNGADKLDFSIGGSGALTGVASGSGLAALSAGQVRTLALATSSPGISTGTVSVTSSSEAVADGQFSQQVSTTVLAHSTPSFSGASEVGVATIDFGVRGRTLGVATLGFAVHNLADISGFTARLDLDSISGSGDTGTLSTTATPFANRVAGSTTAFDALLADSVNGSFESIYTLHFSDENLPGSTARGPLTLVLKGIVATPGDADLNGTINFDDFARIDSGFNGQLTGWANGDFDRNGVINFDDYALIDTFYNQPDPGAGPTLSAVPEPSLAAVALGMIPLLRSRCARRSHRRLPR